jgi:hypothetical protein
MEKDGMIAKWKSFGWIPPNSLRVLNPWRIELLL